MFSFSSQNRPPPPPLLRPFPPPWIQSILSVPPPPANSPWNPSSLHRQITNIRENVNLLKSIKTELEAILALKSSDGNCGGGYERFAEEIKKRGLGLDLQELISLDAAKSVYSSLVDQMTPLRAVVDTDRPGLWEERSEAVGLKQKLHKYKRNKKWKKKKRKRIAEMILKEREAWEKADREADEWIAKEVAKDTAKRKVEKMKEIAKKKANEERKRLESEFELVLVVEKLQELRTIRVQKLKKQGHFLPEEDNEFLARVQAAVEEEERQAAAAADNTTAKDAIASAEVSRKSIKSFSNETKDVRSDTDLANTDLDQSEALNEKNSPLTLQHEPQPKDVKEQSHVVGYDSMSNLPVEFYHYYHGSNYDMGTLIEVRRTWDTYIRCGGSRIPGHWVRPPPPANEVWASYVVENEQ
ncbi:hypothetical protein ZOSMA_14G00780 [Zostera marina]|uniref:Uncharacterized protein n=1 Tax=Zostera marina TaxID=29655 RepID=A0A0K9PWF2_ZOSMR|nr:hypothetical protein ZOSMA_14G00780 [Zostera marina]